MKKLYCYLGVYPNTGTISSSDSIVYHLADLSNVFRNNPFPTIELEKVLFHLYPMHEQLEEGQLFYFTKIEKPGSIEINVEPLDILEYPHILNGFRLFNKSGNSTNYSNMLRNLTMKRLDNYYDSVVLRELRNKKIDLITKD